MAEAAWAANSNYYWARAALALCNLRMEKYQEGLSQLRLAGIPPDNEITGMPAAFGLAVAALCYAKMGNCAKAAEALHMSNEALAEFEKGGGINHDLARRDHLYQETAELTRRSITEEANKALGLSRSALLAAAGGENYQKAEDLARQATQLAPTDPEVLRSQATVLRWSGKLSAALEALNRLAELQPVSPELCNERGLLLEQVGTIEEARALFTRAIGLANADTNQFLEIRNKALKNRARLNRKSGEYGEAAADLSLALGTAERPANAEAQQVDLSAYYNVPWGKRWTPPLTMKSEQDWPPPASVLATEPAVPPVPG